MESDVPAPFYLFSCCSIRYYMATVLNFTKWGTKLALGVDKPGYLHVTKMKPKGEFVKSPSDILKVEDVIPVRIRKIKLNEVEAGRC